MHKMDKEEVRRAREARTTKNPEFKKQQEAAAPPRPVAQKKD
jgi:hypothetical protein